GRWGGGKVGGEGEEVGGGTGWRGFSHHRRRGGVGGHKPDRSGRSSGAVERQRIVPAGDPQGRRPSRLDGFSTGGRAGVYAEGAAGRRQEAGGDQHPNRILRQRPLELVASRPGPGSGGRVCRAGRAVGALRRAGGGPGGWWYAVRLEGRAAQSADGTGTPV